MFTQDQILEALQENFGFTSLRGLQEKAINSVLNQRDTLVIMPTGGGKSLCYQLPAILMEGVAVVVSPLISLMQDQVENLRQFGIESAFINSSLDYSERLEVEEKLVNGEVKILYIAPEGLLTTNGMVLMRRLNISFFAIDEAHCVSQWGHEFRADYRRLRELKEHFPVTPCLALTATADLKTKDDIAEALGMNDAEVLVSSFDRPNIKYSVYERTDEIKQLDDFLKENHEGDTGIVYCLSRNKVEKTAEMLQSMGYNAIPYHAGMTTKQRSRNLEKFKIMPEVIVVATIAFGMGIDRPDVRFVAHLDLPKSIEGYYQETGRAGRDGKESNAWMVYGLSDIVKLSRMLEQTEATEQYKVVARQKLDSMLAFCETSKCRRRVLLDYFSPSDYEDCGNCDVCLDPPEIWDASVAAQKILSTIYRTGQKYGAGYIIDVLRGSKSAKILERFDNQLSVYGIGSDISKQEWNSILRQLLTLGLIRIKDWEYRSLALTEDSRAVLRGEEKLNLRKLKIAKKALKKEKVSKEKRESLAEHGKEDLFELLREERMRLAKENKVPPYIIFGDKSLHDMCSIMPLDEDQMKMVHGVGASKFDKYGEEFLEVIKSYES